MFAQQSNPNPPRPAPGLGTNRLQNGKLSNTAPSMPSWQSNATSRNTFAQTLGTQQQSSNSALDLSDFPSLGGASSTQQNAQTNQSMWSNPTIRTPAPTNRRPSDEFDSYRFNGRTPANATEDFPPLGGDESRNTLLSTFSNQTPIGLPQSSRLGYDQSIDRNPTPRGRTLTNPNPFPIPESNQPLGLGAIGSSQVYGQNSNQIGGFPSRNGFPDGIGSLGISDLSIQNSMDLSGPTPNRNRPGGQTPKKRIADMTSREKLGLNALLAKLNPEHPDFSPMALGMDLNELGLDLNRPPSTPLYTTLGTPFGPPGHQDSRPPIPDFTLPAAYKVKNVPPLHGKIPSMSDDCLLFIFYSAPRDLAQELAAQELYTREWRWHTKLKIWIHRDPQSVVPAVRRGNAERGVFIVFNPQQWRKERLRLDLDPDALEQR